MSRKKVLNIKGCVILAVVVVSLFLMVCTGGTATKSAAVAEDETFTYTGRTVTIGNLTWMAENLNRPMNNSWCYNNDDSNCEKYGRLYNWNTAMKACPAGWRLPTNENWNDLISTVGGNNVAGKKLRSTSGWTRIEGCRNGTDEFSFSALPGGLGLGGSRGASINFNIEGFSGNWWSGTESSARSAWGQGMACNEDGVKRGVIEKSNLLSVRCVRDGGTAVAESDEFVEISIDSSSDNVAVAESEKPVEIFTDPRDSQNYRTVVIGAQTWMAENLNYSGSGNDLGACYLNSPDSCAKYGRLYDWATVMGLESICNSTNCASQIQAVHQGICPVGWHVPSYDEWMELNFFVDKGRMSGRKLKAETGWNTIINHDIGTNEFGFSALPGGYGFDNNFFDVGDYGSWWSATMYGARYAWILSMSSGGLLRSDHYGGMNTMSSVRCIKTNEQTVVPQTDEDVSEEAETLE